MRTIRKVMAYIFMPLLFLALDVSASYIIFQPLIQDVKSYANLLLLDDVPDFSEDNNEIEKDKLIEELKNSRKKYEAEDTETEADDTEEDTTEEKQIYIPLSQIEWPVYGEPYAWIKCERLGLDSVLYYGDGYELLRKGVGQYIGSYIPGYGRPLMVCAHNTRHFECMQYIEKGDIIEITTGYGDFEYQVDDIQILLATDLNAYDMQKEEEQLIMYTCYPFERLSTRHKYRYFVYCSKISGPILEQ